MALEQAPTLVSDTDLTRRKLFTVGEANRSLVYVRRIATDVMSTYERIVELRRILEEDGSVDLSQAETEYERKMDSLSELMDELHLVGVELRDFEQAIIEFPAWHRGHEVMLTWKSGQASITGWHEHEDSPEEIRPVSDLDLAA